MSGEAWTGPTGCVTWPRWLVFAVILGFYLTLRGYHSFDGDQAYRLPLLLHWQDPDVFADDPFVKAFDTFNPHRGSLVVMDVFSRPLGLAAGLFVIFVLTFAVTCVGVDRLAGAVWPGAGAAVGLVAIGLVLVAKAGNIGTNHLFEAMVLDRLIAFALGWLAMASVVAEPARGRTRAMVAIGLATWVHPSVGLQLALVLGASWTVWCLLGRRLEVRLGTAVLGVGCMALAVLPGLVVNLWPGSSLMGNMPAEDFWHLTAELQSPQHMLPHLWRMPQWLAWGCYLSLAVLALVDGRLVRSHDEDVPAGPRSAARLRLIALLAVILIGLGAAWFGIEVLHQIRVTVFQPFRMATVARGIALVLVSGRLVALWRAGGWLGRMRATLMMLAFGGDWLLVVVTLAELTASAATAIRRRIPMFVRGDAIEAAAWFGMLAIGFNFLNRHDTEYGNRTLLAGLGAGVVLAFLSHERFGSRRGNGSFPIWTPRRLRVAMAVAWIVPAAALVAAAVSLDDRGARQPLVRSLINRCRFAAVPADDVERLAVWCKDHTPPSARFIGPPGPKTFRLWSSRSLAFNRAASPYNAIGLADWFSRFQEHVDFHGSPVEFVRAYVADRHGFEMRYQTMSDADRAALALRQGATYVVAAAPDRTKNDQRDSHSIATSFLNVLHVEGRYAVYQVNPGALVQHQR